MAHTAKRYSISFTKEDLRELDLLSKFFEECPTSVVRRAITLLYYITFKERKDNGS